MLPRPPASHPRRKLFKLPLSEAITVFIMSSQKSAPVAVTVISYIAEPATQGLLAIPCIVGQLTQIFIGSSLTGYFARQVAEQKRQAVAAQEDAAGPLPGAAAAAAEDGPEGGKGAVVDVEAAGAARSPGAAGQAEGAAAAEARV
jgi:sodium/bile acid cotransporter 7